MQKSNIVKQKKRGRGRPALSAGTKGEAPFVGIRLPKDQIAAIDKLAKREGVARSEMIRRLIATGQAVMEKH